MAKANSHLRPRAGTAADLAGRHIHTHGAATASELFAAVNFGRKLSEKAGALQRAVMTGWLVEQVDGKIGIGLFARTHYDQQTAKEAGAPPAPVGQIAAPRQQADVFKRPPLSRQYIPNPRGIRQDIPAWSVRTGQSFHTKA